MMHACMAAADYRLSLGIGSASHVIMLAFMVLSVVSVVYDKQLEPVSQAI
jgi:hypothetical protein